MVVRRIGLSLLVLLSLALGMTALAQEATPETTPEIAPEATAEPALELVGTRWQWLRFESADGSTLEVPTPENYLLRLNDDGTAGLKIDCNSGSSSYTLEGTALTIAPGASTLMACPEGSLAGQYSEYLGQVATYVLEDGLLYLNLAMDSGNMVFAPYTASLTGFEWRWVEAQSADGSVTQIPHPANYNLTLFADGTLAFRADCNQGNGTYTREGQSLTLEMGVMTLVACPPDSLEAAYREYLTTVQSYAIENGELLLTLADGAVLRFVLASVDDAVGAEWQLQEFQIGAEELTTVADPASYTLMLNDDGSLSVKADCNQGSGTYTVVGGQLTLDVATLTKAACPPDSLSEPYLEYLANVAQFQIQPALEGSNNLMLYLEANGGYLLFASS